MKASENKTKLSYAFSYGFLGGPKHSRRLRELLERQGYVPAASLGKADIIIGHSAGCRLLPKQGHPKLILLVGATLTEEMPSRAFRQAQRENIKAFLRNRHLVKGLAIGTHSFWYGITQPFRNWTIIREAKELFPELELASACTVFVAGKNDPWPRSDNLLQYIADHQWAFLSLPGSHNDIWEHSERYVAIINHYAGLLAQTDK